MSSPAAAPIDPVAEVASPAPEPKPKKPRASRAKKEATETTTEKKKEKEESTPAAKDKESKLAKGAAKRKPAGEKHPPFEEIIRECIAEAKEDVREGVSRPAIKSKSTLRPVALLLTEADC